MGLQNALNKHLFSWLLLLLCCDEAGVIDVLPRQHARGASVLFIILCHISCGMFVI